MNEWTMGIIIISMREKDVRVCVDLASAEVEKHLCSHISLCGGETIKSPPDKIQTSDHSATSNTTTTLAYLRFPTNVGWLEMYI